MSKVPTIRLLASLVACFAVATAYPSIATAQESQEESENQDRDSEQRDSEQRDQQESNRDNDSSRDDSSGDSNREDDSDRDQASNRSSDSQRSEQARRQRDRDQWDQNRGRRDRFDRNRSGRDRFPAPRDSYDVYRDEQSYSEFDSQPSDARSRSNQGNEAGLGVTVDQSDRGEGVVVTRVLPGSPAEQMGLQERDRITHVNGEEVRSAQQFASQVRDMNPGDEIELDIQRDDNDRSLSGELESRREALVVTNRGTSRQGDQAWQSDRDPYRQSDEGYSRQQRRFSDSQGRDSFQRRSGEQSQRDLANRINTIQRQIDRLSNELDELRYALRGREGQGRQTRAYRADQGETTASYQEYDADRQGEFRDSSQRWQGESDRQPSGSWSGEGGYRSGSATRGYRSDSGPGVSGENYGDTAPNYRIRGESTQGGEIGGERLRPGQN